MNEQADFVSATAAFSVPPPVEAIARWIGNRRDREDRLIGSITDNPLESLLGLLPGGSVLFRLFALHHPSAVGACGLRRQRHRFGSDGLPHAGAARGNGSFTLSGQRPFAFSLWRSETTT